MHELTRAEKERKSLLKPKSQMISAPITRAIYPRYSRVTPSPVPVTQGGVFAFRDPNGSDRRLRPSLSKGTIMAMIEKIEYSVRKVTRYFVTRYHEYPHAAGSEPKGEYDDEEVAPEVAYALCKAEHDRLGWPADDERIQYPKRETQCTRAGVAASGASC